MACVQPILPPVREKRVRIVILVVLAGVIRACRAFSQSCLKPRSICLNPSTHILQTKGNTTHSTQLQGQKKLADLPSIELFTKETQFSVLNVKICVRIETKFLLFLLMFIQHFRYNSFAIWNLIALQFQSKMRLLFVMLYSYVFSQTLS